MLTKNDLVQGRILDVKKGIPFIKNGSFNLETKMIKTQFNQVAQFPAIADLKIEYNGFWQKVWHAIIKNGKIKLYENDSINVKLIKPIKININTGWIIE